jgi:hypothetical protein
MEVDSKLTLLRERPERVPRRIGEHRCPEPVGLAGHDQPAVTLVGCTADLAHRFLDVPERDRGERDQPAGVGGGSLGQEVVIGPNAVKGQLGRQPGERTRPEAAHVWVDQLSVYAHIVHPPEALLG